MTTNLPSTNKNTSDFVEKDFLSWFYSEGIGLVVTDRKRQIANAFAFFNFTDLFVHLFSPYRRMIAKGKMTIFDRLSYNLISSFVGAGVRLVLILTGFLALPFIFLYQLIVGLILVAIPVFSMPRYTKITGSRISAGDLESSDKLKKKLISSSLFKYLTLYFEDDFPTLFEKLPNGGDIKLTVGMTLDQVLISLGASWPTMTQYLDSKSIKKIYYESLIKFLFEYLEKPPKVPIRPIGQIMDFGYTNTLDKFAYDVGSKKLANAHINHELLLQIEKIMIRPQNNNVLLVGEPGVGRHTIIEAIASAIQREMLSNLIGRRVVILNTISLLSSSSDSGQGGVEKEQVSKDDTTHLIEVKSNFENLLEEAKRAGNIIISIDQIDQISSPRQGRVDVSEVLTNVLTDNSLPIIGITTPNDFNKYVRPNANLLSLFEKIDIEEAGIDETLIILCGKALEIWQKEKISTPLTALVEIVDKSTRVVGDRLQPEKSIILLDDSVASAKGQKINRINVELVDKIISLRTKTPVGKIAQTEAGKLKDLEAILHKRIIGQDEAIIQIAKAMRRARTGLGAGKKPIGSFLFLGPTGVGKTETAKALAEAYFGNEEEMIRLDMSEYQAADSFKRLIGDTINETPGQLTSLVRDHPFGLLLLDEFEKAHASIHNLFLQVFDEGFLTDAFGKRVGFGNLIIIATSNAGSEYIREQIASGKTLSGDALINFLLSKGLFTPELLNRFDGVIVYRPLINEEVAKVAELMLLRLSKQLKETKNISLEITQELAQKVAQSGYDMNFGARPIQRLIADKIEDEIAKMLLANQVKNGDTIPAEALLKFVV